ncbi:MAG: nucleotide sugar dehydrogenase [Candidatus Aenigmarchaeota archaeon]|nr:nucleotide sugar dehydrogenase [Candidatus Aenigmarchaeota archaeon]
MKVCVIGLGYIGFPTACLMARAGHNVVGVDISEERVNNINNGSFLLNEPGFKELFDSAKKNIVAKMNPEKADVFVICVPTPLKNKTPDNSYVESAANAIAPLVEKENLVILESTVMPKATHESIGKIIENKTSLKADTDFYLAHCPERAFPGNLIFELVNNDRIIGSDTEKGKEITKELYSSFCKGNLLLTGTVTAEVAKLSENTFRSVNIAFANELALLSEKLGINVEEVISLANKHPRVNIHTPGAGVGGHCIPVDPYFLVHGQNAPLVKTALEINESMPKHTIALLKNALHSAGKNIEGAKVVLLGAAYKPDVDDARESPTEKLVEILVSYKSNVVVHDPLVKRFAYPVVSDIGSAVDGADAIIISTAHSEYKKIDWNRISKKMNVKPVIVDGRNLLSSAPPEFIYKSIGNPVQ